MKKIALFGGTFDPPHFGHLNLAIQLFEKHGLDQVLFCPNFHSPFKTDRPPIASPEQRGEMVALAIKPIPSFHLLKYEIERNTTSYTVDTLRSLSHPNHNLYLMLSEDALFTFHLWKDAFEILRLAQPLIGTRRSFSDKIPSSPLSSQLLKGVSPTSQMEISSTEIRSRLTKDLYCGHLLPDSVLCYIHGHKLYQ